MRLQHNFVEATSCTHSSEIKRGKKNLFGVKCLTQSDISFHISMYLVSFNEASKADLSGECKMYKEAMTELMF